MDKLVVIKGKSKCSFCGCNTNNQFLYGPMYKLGTLKVHYYCVLLSNRLIQNGDDHEGILGFLLSDIEKELHRTSKIHCAYCKKNYATIKCAAKKCRKSFHLPCGIKKGSLHEFIDPYKSFCHMHRPVRSIPRKILNEVLSSEIICCICQEKVDTRNKIKSLWAPCCNKAWYHRFCIQKYAYSAGYFFKCAACNDIKKFWKCMQKFGIFIPQQDASWELVPDAFQELLYRYNKCDAKLCKCPEGRQKNKDKTIWEIVLCKSCGSQGMHVLCGNLQFSSPKWECPVCQKVTKSLTPGFKIHDSIKPAECSSELSKVAEVGPRKRRRESGDLKNSILDKRKKCRVHNEKDMTEEENEVEIDVETVEEERRGKSETESEEKNFDFNQANEFQNVLGFLKPGPLSYKLSLFRKMMENLSSKKKGENSDSPEVILLSDSDEKEDADLSEEGEGQNNEFDQLTFSADLCLNKWNNNHQKFIFNENSDKVFMKEVGFPNFFYPRSNVNIGDILKKKKTEQDFKHQEEDLKNYSDDEVILLSD